MKHAENIPEMAYKKACRNEGLTKEESAIVQKIYGIYIEPTAASLQAVFSGKSDIGEAMNTQKKMFDTKQALDTLQEARTLIQASIEAGAKECIFHHDAFQTAFGSTKSGQRAIILGEQHGNPISLHELEKILRHLEGVPADDMLILNEDGMATSSSFRAIKEELAAGKFRNPLPGALEIMNTIAKDQHMPVEHCVATTCNPDVFTRAALLAQRYIPNIKTIDLMAYECMRNVQEAQNFLHTTDPQRIRKIKQAAIMKFSATWKIPEKEIEDAMQNTTMMQKLDQMIKISEVPQEISIATFTKICAIDALTQEQIKVALAKHPSSQVILAFAGASHIASIRNTLGFR
jgi:hypothetical protein